MTVVYSFSSSELRGKTKTATTTGTYSCSICSDDFDSDDDYVMEGESAPENSPEIPDDENLDESPEISSKAGSSPEPQPKKTSGFRRVFVSGSTLLSVLKSVVILAFCLQIPGTVDKFDGDGGGGRQLIIIPNFTLESASVFPVRLQFPVSNATATANVTAGWKMIFNVGNPSENQALSFGDISAEVYYGKNPLHHVLPLSPLLNRVIPTRMTAEPISKTVVPCFNQTRTRQDLVKVTIESYPVSIANATATSLAEDINSGASSAFSVRLFGYINETRNPDGSGWFSATCPVKMAFLETGAGVMASSSEECKVLSSGGLERWMTVAISFAVVQATMHACSYFSSGKIRGQNYLN